MAACKFETKTINVNGMAAEHVVCETHGWPFPLGVAAPSECPMGKSNREVAEDSAKKQKDHDDAEIAAGRMKKEK